MNEDYKVEKHAICYFDVLGYKQALQKLGENRYIHYMVCVMDTVETVLKSNDMIPFEYHIFSDNVIVFVPLKDGLNETITAVSELIKCVSILQRNLIGQYGIFIRGCITLGDLYYDGRFVFGSGLIKAYSMENEIALYPRLVLDEECAKLCHDIGGPVWEITKSTYVRRDVDGYYFVGYLYSLCQNRANNEDECMATLHVDPMDTSEYIHLPDPFSHLDFSSNKRVQCLFKKYRSKSSHTELYYLLLHKINIERNIAIATDEKTIKKYTWCKNYHNQVCNEQGIFELIIK